MDKDGEQLMPSRKGLITKADLALADLAANGGTLTKEQSIHFSYHVLAGTEVWLLGKVKHHLDRAEMHNRAKNYAYAAGSYRKAAKWAERLIDRLKYLASTENVMVNFVADSIATDIEDMILNGSGRKDGLTGLLSPAPRDGKPRKIGFTSRILRKAKDTEGKQ